MNLPNKLTILRVIMIPFFVAALLYDGGANQNMRYVAAALAGRIICEAYKKTGGYDVNSFLFGKGCCE